MMDEYTTNIETKQEEYNKAVEKNHVAGYLQLIAVIIFIGGALFTSTALQSTKKDLGEREAENRVLLTRVATVNPADYRVSFTTTGSVRARADIAVVPQVSGQIVSVNDAFFEGGVFYPKEVLFQVEPLDFELEVDRLEAEVAQAQTAYDLEIAEAEAALAAWKKVNKNKTPPELVARTPQKVEALAKLNAAKAQLEDAKLDLQRTSFSMPFTGRVLSTSLEQGQYVSAGQSYGMVYDINTLEVRASLEDKKLNWLLGSDEDPVITIDAMYLGKEKTYKGYIKRGVSSLNAQTRFATVAFGFKDIPGDLVPGVFVDLNIKGPKLEDVYIVPVDVVQKGSLIWALDKEDRIYEVDAEIVYLDEDVLVLRGLAGEKRFVTSKLPGAVEGMKVNIDASNGASPDVKSNDQRGAVGDV